MWTSSKLKKNRKDTSDVILKKYHKQERMQQRVQSESGGEGAVSSLNLSTWRSGDTQSRHMAFSREQAQAC